jgi:tetratricopeptide (TPR) repeat protein
MATSAVAATTDVQQQLIDGVRFHQQGRLDRAAAIYEGILKFDSDHADALHLSGLIAHSKGDETRARDRIERAIAANANQPAYHNSLGTVELSANRLEESAACFRRALTLDPGYAEAHNNLGNALQQAGHFEQALQCYKQAVTIRPNYAEAHFNRGQAFVKLGNLQGAIASFRGALEINPNYVKAWRLLGEALAQSGEVDHAAACCFEALKHDPKDAETLTSLAAIWEHGSSRLEEALAKAEEALQVDRGNLRAIALAARCERRLGRIEDGVKRLERLKLERLDHEAGAYAVYEMAMLLDRAGDFGRAYDFFTLGNRLANRSAHAQRSKMQVAPQLIERLGERFTPQWVASWTPRVPSVTPDPVFLIGFPRSGTTLMEQILDSHPSLSTLEERPAIERVRVRLSERPEGYPDALATLQVDEVDELRRFYFDEVTKHVGDVKQRTVIDKLPLNTIEVGLIYRLFPNAKILLALRHPCDVVISGFMQEFKPNDAMIHFRSLVETARFYDWVMALWLKYASVLPLTYLSVRYEDLVEDFEGQTRRILEFLGLPWDDAVRGYADRAKSKMITTPSYHQVVQPIYSHSVGRWLNYRQPMKEVLPILQPYIDAFGYESPQQP